MFVGLFVVGLCALRRFGAQADIRITFTDVTIPIMNPIYFDVRKTECSTDENSSGESTLGCNITLIKRLPRDTDFNWNLMGLSMGEFVVPSGMAMSMKICEVADEPIIMGPFFSTLFPTDKCPPEPNVYTTKGYVTPLHLLPDSFVENTYKLILDFRRRNKSIIKVETTLELSY